MTKTKQYITELVAEHVPTGGELSKIDKLILRTQLERLVALAKSELAQEIEQRDSRKNIIRKDKMKLNTNSKAESIEEYFNLSNEESFEIKMLAMGALCKVVKENREKGEFRFTQLMDEFFKKEFDSPEKLAFAMHVLTRYIYEAKERKGN